MSLPNGEVMTYKAMKSACDVGTVERAIVFRDPATRQYELAVMFRRSEPRSHLRRYTLITQRGECRTFKTIDWAFKVANDLNIYSVEVVADPLNEFRRDTEQQRIEGL